MLPTRRTSIPEPLSVPPIRYTHDTVTIQILETSSSDSTADVG